MSASLVFPVTQPKTHYGTHWSSQAGCPLGKPLDNILQGLSNGRAIIPVYRQGTVKLMAMTDGCVMPSSRTRTMRELLHPSLLPRVTAHPAKPGTQGQEQRCQFVILELRSCQADGEGWWHMCAPSGGERLHSWQKGSTDGSRWQLSNCSSGNCQSFSGDIQCKSLLCCQGCCAALCNHLATSVVLN